MDDSNDPAESGYFRNWVSISGIGLMLVSLFGGGVVTALELLAGRALPYAGILYLLCTVGIVVGFLLVPLGALIERSRRKRGRGRRALSEFRFDLQNRQHRLGALALLVSAVLTLTLVPVGAYQSFHATESREFCGELCHEVMNPEWVRYQDSPHARVECVDCHIGPGADWFVRSKLSGLRQVWAVATDSFPRPIPTPIRDLRPARETCEECHWRRQFIGYKEIDRSYYLSDEENPVHHLRMLLKVGGEKTILHAWFRHSLPHADRPPRRVHRHRRAEAGDRLGPRDARRRQRHGVRPPPTTRSARKRRRRSRCAPWIAWIATIGRPTSSPCRRGWSTTRSQGAASLSSFPRSRCRPSVRSTTVTRRLEEAMTGIASSMRDFYEENYPEVSKNKARALTSSIEKLQGIYRETIFPEMKADWSAHPDNIGHRDAPGCFRCHNDEMESAEGDTITTTCHTCHLILAQGESTEQVNVDLEEGLPFIHPEDFDTIEEYTECHDCHTGGAELYE